MFLTVNHESYNMLESNEFQTKVFVYIVTDLSDMQ